MLIVNFYFILFYFNFELFNVQKVGKFRHQRKHSIEIDNNEHQNEFDNDGTQPIEVADAHSNLDTHHSPSTSQQAEDAAPNHQIMREEWAAICIQTAFRGFLVIHHISSA